MEYQFLKTLPGKSLYHLFDQLSHDLYLKGSSRFKLGHDPVVSHLEGCYTLLRHGKPVGRFAFYENPSLEYQGQAAACIGSYECIPDQKTSHLLLEKAKELAAQKKYQWLIGPMEGSTTHPYRFSQNNQSPNFFMEPYHHIYYNKQFQKAGFQSIAEYCSNQTSSFQYSQEAADQLEQNFIENGATFRNLNLKDLDSDLRKIAVLSQSAFADNFLYTPIQIEDFVTKYKKHSPLFDPRLIWIVEDQQQEMQAFLFAIKDYCDPKQETLIIKSMARKKTSSFKGIGSVLSAKAYQTAKALNYKKVIHAFIYQDNNSLSISKNFSGSPYKSYALYGLKTNI